MVIESTAPGAQGWAWLCARHRHFYVNTDGVVRSLCGHHVEREPVMLDPNSRAIDWEMEDPEHSGTCRTCYRLDLRNRQEIGCL